MIEQEGDGAIKVFPISARRTQLELFRRRLTEAPEAFVDPFPKYSLHTICRFEPKNSAGPGCGMVSNCYIK